MGLLNMKNLNVIVGVILILLGVISFSYQGINYTKKEKVLEIGNVQLTAHTQEKFYLSPILGGVCLIAGIVLLVIRRK